MARVIENKGLISGLTLLLITILTPFYGTITMLYFLWTKWPSECTKTMKQREFHTQNHNQWACFQRYGKPITGRHVVDWRKAPFFAYYKDFDIEGCVVPQILITCGKDLHTKH